MFIPLIPFIQTVGYAGIGAVIFSETGLLVGFFLPGDSLLFTAGLLASQGYLNIYILIAVTFTSALVGDSVGYSIGKKAGPKIFKKKDSFWFDPDHIKRARVFFRKYGVGAIILARFLPLVRTFVPVVAGVGTMPYHKFFFGNFIGAILWAVGVALAGFFLGGLFPGIDQYLLPIIILIIILSFLPTAIHVFKEKKARESVWHGILRLWRKIFKRK